MGPEGVTYEHVGEHEIEPEGPAALAISPTGEFYILDTAGLGVVRIASDVTTRYALDWPDITSLIDLAPTSTGMRILNVDFNGAGHVVDVSASGVVGDMVELPPALRLEHGLSGIATGPNGELWVELEGGNRIAEVDPETGSYQIWPGYPYPNGTYGPRYDEPFTQHLAFQANRTEVTLEAQPGNYVDAALLGINPDG